MLSRTKSLETQYVPDFILYFISLHGHYSNLALFFVNVSATQYFLIPLQDITKVHSVLTSWLKI